MAVLYGAAVLAHDATDIIQASDAGFDDGHVLYDAAVSGTTEEALVMSIGLVDADAADGVAVAVEGASESNGWNEAYGGEVVFCAGVIVPFGGGMEVEVGGHLEGEARAVESVVHMVGEVGEV